MDSHLQEESLSRFPELPPELQTHVLSYRPELAKQYSETSKLARELTSDIYLQQLCQRPISEKEVIDYIKTAPRTFGVFSENDTTSELIYGAEPDVRYYVVDEHYLIGTVYYLNGRDYISPIDINAFTRIGPIEEASPDFLNYLQQNNINYEDTREYGLLDLGPSHQTKSTDEALKFITSTTDPGGSPRLNYSYNLDLASEYYIYQRRLGCAIRDPNFGKTQILDKLNRIYQNAKTNNIDDLLRCYVRLYTEAIIHNIYPKPPLLGTDGSAYVPIPPLGESYQEPAGIPGFHAEIENLYPIIRKRLQCL